MSESRSVVPLVAFAFIAGAGVGVAGTMIATRPSPAGQPAAATTTASTTTSSAGPASAAGTGVFINEREVAQAQLDLLKQAYGAAPPPARYWYDPRSGLYGIWGHEAGGYIRAGHDFGALAEDASKGNTGVFINGRHLNLNEALYIRNTFGAVYQGRWWLDGTGTFGMEGNEMPLGNLVAALQAAQRSGGGGGGSGGGGYRWRDEINRSSGGAENGCVWVNTPGSSYMSSGC